MRAPGINWKNIDFLVCCRLFMEDTLTLEYFIKLTIIRMNLYDCSDKTVRAWRWVVGQGFVEESFSPLLGHKYGVTSVRISPQVSYKM